MKEKEILDIFKKTGAILEGHFQLSSGLHSAKYLQCAKVMAYPEYAEKLCKTLAKKILVKLTKPASPAGGHNAKPTAVIAPALGGIIVSYEVARALGVKSLFTERVDGKMTLRRGFEISAKDKILVVEDVLTTGRSTNEVIEAVKSRGATIAGVGCIVNRSGKNLDLGLEIQSLIKIAIPTFKPENCPLCRKGLPAVKPGSRAIS